MLFITSTKKRERTLSFKIVSLLLITALANGNAPSASSNFGLEKRIVVDLSSETTPTDQLDDFDNITSHEQPPPRPSFLTIDPSKILSSIVNHAGLLIPDSVENDLKLLAKVCSVGLAELNILERRLILRNFTVSSTKGDRHTLRVGKVHMRWDSYLKPCLEIEVEDVHFLVEFTNLVLTRNNWHELQEKGFPPPLLTDSSENSTDFFNHLRIGSLDFSGNLTAELRSRPLDTHLQVLSFDLDTFDDFNLRIRDVATTKSVSHERKGITTEELYDMIKVYFHDKILQFLSSSLHELTHNPVTESKLAHDVGHFFTSAADTLRNYTTMATNHKRDTLLDTVSAKLTKWGVTVSSEELGLQAKQFGSKIWGFSHDRWKELRIALQNADQKVQEFWENQKGDESATKEIIFPDW